MKKNIIILTLLIFVTSVFAHDVHNEPPTLKEWNLDGRSFKGSFLYHKKDSVFFENEMHQVLGFSLNNFVGAEKKYLQNKIKEVNHLNEPLNNNPKREHLNTNLSTIYYLVGIFLLIALAVVVFLTKKSQKVKSILPVVIFGISIILYSFTDPYEVQSAFLPFAPNVNTFWDNTYFYVESKGIPTSHTMMVGISNHGWQQQVPIPQCYIGANAWSIPLNPVMAPTPIPVDQVHFTRGAIAIAVNGVPIFNPYTNTGVDAYLDGQLDSFGGHSGKGDDYHYHTAPLHLYNQTTNTLPIAYAFDGFAVFGSLEPDGTQMISLDANHGHLYNGVYHYHGTNTAPYMIAKFAGVVTEDATHQLIPQAQASPVRTENWTPLNGALITSCTPNISSNGYDLSYTLNGISGYATNYSWSGPNYSFNYVTPSGNNVTNYNGFNQCELPLSTFENSIFNNLLIYPNPFNEELSVKNSNDNQFYVLFNSFGQVIYSGIKMNEQNFSHLNSGIYYLQVEGNKELIKLIKN